MQKTETNSQVFPLFFFFFRNLYSYVSRVILKWILQHFYYLKWVPTTAREENTRDPYCY